MQKNWLVTHHRIRSWTGENFLQQVPSREGRAEVGDDAMAPPADDVGEAALLLSAAVDSSLLKLPRSTPALPPLPVGLGRLVSKSLVVLCPKSKQNNNKTHMNSIIAHRNNNNNGGDDDATLSAAFRFLFSSFFYFPFFKQTRPLRLKHESN